VQELLQQLRDARLHAAADEMEDAKQHMDEVLEFLDDALAQRSGPKPSVLAIRGYIAEARFAATKSDSLSAVAALDEALRALDEKPAANRE
jgi:hypothetical protein